MWLLIYMYVVFYYVIVVIYLGLLCGYSFLWYINLVFDFLRLYIFIFSNIYFFIVLLKQNSPKAWHHHAVYQV